MILLDTDTLVLFNAGHARITARIAAAEDVIATTVITQIEILRGRFDFLFKAADGDQLQRAQQWLEQSARDLLKFVIIPVDVSAASEFDRLRQNRKLRKIGRADLLIASIVLAHRATLVTRNVRHFRQVPGLKVENWAD